MIVSTAPHIRIKRTTKRIMLDVLLSLFPATAAGVVYFGWQAAVLVLLSLVTAFLSEFCYFAVQEKLWVTPKEKLKKFFHQFDFTSLVTGLLLALSLPCNLNGWYLPVLGSLFAVVVVKMLFGGTGKNVVNPAVAGRIFLFVSFAAMTAYPAARFPALYSNGVVTGATQLQSLLSGGAALSPLDLFLGTGVAGCLGETCKLALLAGGVYLVVRGVIRWYLPLLYIGATGLYAVVANGFDFSAFLPSVLSGGLMLGAIFMATDYVTTPKSRVANIVYFLLLGLLTGALRQATGLETVSFAILLMNVTVPLFDLASVVFPFGSRFFESLRGRLTALFKRRTARRTKEIQP